MYADENEDDSFWDDLFLEEQIKQLEERIEWHKEDLRKFQQENIDLKAKVEELELELNYRRHKDGRRGKFSVAQQKLIRASRNKGSTIQQLATMYDCSTSTIHAIVKDLDVDLRRKI